MVFGNANRAGEENRNIARMGTLLAGRPLTPRAVGTVKDLLAVLDTVLAGRSFLRLSARR